MVTSRRIMFCLGSMSKGGAERVTAQLANSFIENGDIVSIVVTKAGTQHYKIDEKIGFFSLGYEKHNFIKRTIFRILELRRIIKKEQPDIIIAFLPEPSFRVLFANLFNGKKIIISVRNDPNAEYNNLMKKILAKFLYRRANGLVFQTEDAKKWFPKSIQKKSTIIMNPLSDEFLIAPFVGKRKKEIVTVGRLVEQKNQKLLIDAFGIVNEKNPEYTLKIIGSGKLRSELEEYAKEKGLSEKVMFLGEVQDVKKEIKEAAAFVLSSNYEGMPNALLEALAMGIPSVSTDCPCGGPKVLMRGYPLRSLAKVNDCVELTECIERTLRITEQEQKEIRNFAIKIQTKTECNTIMIKWKKYISEVNNEN